ncbi:MAG: hypothetical protein M1821_003722 [Bathelium mastoideum]|nr:MAG: hypothetical protein M1821_003722 [Bathelium mastoideum]
MATGTLNVLLTSFPGLDLPSTLSIPLQADSSIADLTAIISSRLPSNAPLHNFILTTTSNRHLNPTSSASLTTLLPNSTLEHQPCLLLPLRLSTRLCGGKGGFGSQLRAAGGRMQSRKKRNNGLASSSNRALGGPRYRVIAEAKALAEYYATQPELEQKEREEKRRRWEQVVEAAERKGEEVRKGKGGKVDSKWLEEKEEAEEKMREAVRRAVAGGEVEILGREGSDVSGEGSSEGRSESEREECENEVAGGSTDASKAVQSRTFFGWDEDEDMSSSSDDEDDSRNHDTPSVESSKGKGKAKA